MVGKNRYLFGMILPFKNKVPEVATDCFVAENSTLIGKVKLGSQASIWFGAVLRGDIEPIVIGAFSNIQDNSVVHTSDGFPVTIGEYVTVGHQVTLHGCLVGNNCLIGMGAILLDGSEVGDNCIVGAGALVKQNQKIPPNSLVVGSPARVIRTLSAADISNVRKYADRYIELIKHY